MPIAQSYFFLSILCQEEKRERQKKCEVEENKILGGQTLARSILFNGVFFFLACVYKTINIAPGFVYDFLFFYLWVEGLHTSV
jgi:hypothetical protein